MWLTLDESLNTIAFLPDTLGVFNVNIVIDGYGWFYVSQNKL